MAEKFGGKFSPGSRADNPSVTGIAGGKETPERNAFDGQRPTKVGGRAKFLFIMPLLFIATAFIGKPAGLVAGLLAAAMLFLAAWLTREGIIAQEAYDARRVARRPALPRKMAGSAFIGIGLFAGAMANGQSALMPALIGLIGAALHLFAFGPDPLRDKGMEGIDTFQTDRVARAVDEAEAYLKAMKDAILRAGDRPLETRVDQFTKTARQLFRTVENDPGDLTAARKYLTVYLMGARDSTVKFADFYAQSRNPVARADYAALLDDLETNFAARTTALLGNDHTDLDVEIGVLRDRLKMEG